MMSKPEAPGVSVQAWFWWGACGGEQLKVSRVVSGDEAVGGGQHLGQEVRKVTDE